MHLTRRRFLFTLGGAAVGAAGIAAYKEDPSRALKPKLPLIDFHVHLFGVGDGGTGCVISPTQKRHWTYPFFLRLLNLREGHMDEDYIHRLVSQLRASSMAKAVLLAQDCRYDAKGQPDLASTTSLYVPNDYLFQVVRRFPDLFIPCVSINPKRRDSLEELDRCIANGARVLKIHPPIQDVDLGEPRFRPFLRHCAENKVIVMVHTGMEHSADIVGNDYSDPRELVLPLEEGCTVIAAHAGMGGFFDKEDFFPNLVALMDRFPNLYCDTAVLGDKIHWRCLRRLLEAPGVLKRTIHGSDFPFPSNALVFWNRLSPSELFPLLGESNLLERDYRVKRALGVPTEVFERGTELLVGKSALTDSIRAAA